MTIPSEGVKAQADGNDVTTSFAFPFIFQADEDLKVRLTDKTTEVDTLQTIVTHYTVTGAGVPGGGSVEFGTPPTANDRVTIINNAEPIQPNDFNNTARFDVDIMEGNLDKLTLQDQTLREKLSRALLFPPGTTLSDLEMPLPASDLLLGWNTAADALENKAALGSTVAIVPGDAEKLIAVKADETGLEPVTTPKVDNIDELTGAAGVTVDEVLLKDGGATMSGPLDVTNATDSTSPTTGAGKIAGGLGIVKALWLGGLMSIAGVFSSSNATNSTSPTTGSMKLSGGLGVVKALWVGGLANIAGVLTAAGGLVVTGVGSVSGLLTLNGGLAQAIDALADTAHTLTYAGDRRHTITPTVTRIITLPTTDVIAGTKITVINLAAAQDVTIESSDASDIVTFQDGLVVLEALIDTPIVDTDWALTLNTTTPPVTFPTASVIETTNSTDSTSPTTGSGKFAGGVGIVKALWVGGLANIAGVLTAASAVITGTLTVGSSTNSTTKDTGALILQNGGLGVEGNINAGGFVSGDYYLPTVTIGTGTPVASGLYKDNIPKAWARWNFASFPTELDVFNIFLSTDHGVGDHSFTFRRPMANGSYAILGGVQNDSGTAIIIMSVFSLTAPTTAGFRVCCKFTTGGPAAFLDGNNASVFIIGDQ